MTATRYDIRWCTNCDKLPVGTRGLCRPCYRWWQNYGTARPSRLWSKARQIDFCRCGGIATRGALCFACYHYQRVHGQPRPRHLWERPQNCENCGHWLQPYKRWRGMCDACRQYWYRHGRQKMRPPELWGCDPSLGWCECGRPACERRTVPVPGGHDFSMGYCAECLEMAA